jgi:hypothetical protein
MHLIQSLASGVVGAANGSVTLVERGTSTPVIYYTDFEASQAIQSTLAGIPLDSNGGLVCYVNELVDVKVFDVNGAQLREFVAGDNASAVEVISPSFTGTDYTSGVSGASEPTTLQAVLDAVFASFGTLDWKVLVSGTPTLLTAAVAGLAGLFFNVKTYGAIGDGVADDGAAIQAACNAAAATPNVGGIVFFPPGSYRTTTTPTVTAGVSLLGVGGTSTKVLFDNTGAGFANGISFVGTDSGSRFVQGLWFGAMAVSFTVPLIVVGAGAASCVDFVGCITGGDSFTAGIHIKNTSAGQGSRVTVTRCTGYQGADQSIYQQTSTGRMVVDDCDLLVTLAGAYSHALIDGIDGLNVTNCRYDASAVTSGTIKYISFAPTATWGGCVFTGNRFRENGNAPPVCLYNSLATPSVDCYESGNVFGNTPSSIGLGTIVPYGYATDGYSGTLFARCHSHGSRDGTYVQYSTDANVTVDAKSWETIRIARSAAGAQVISATKGSVGDRLILSIWNPTVGTVTPTLSADFIPDGGTAGIAVTTLDEYIAEFEWRAMHNNVGWVQIAKAVNW